MGKLAKAKQVQREGLFDLYSQNLKVVKEHPGVRIQPDLIDDTYVCPICYGIYLREAATAPDVLTLDHIPSEKLGGKPGRGILLCKKCNNDAGKLLDSNLKRVLDAGDFTNRIPGSSLEGSYTIVDGTKMAATIKFVESDTLQILGDPKRTNPKHIEETRAFLSSLPKESNLKGKVSGAIGNMQLAEIGLLRYAYLMLFRMFGYGAIFYPAIRKVREQIQNPPEQILPRSWAISNFPIADENLGFNIITEPEEARAFVIVFDVVTLRRRRQAIVLPNSSQPGLKVYDWLLAKKQADEEVEFTLTHYPEMSELLTDPQWAFIILQRWKGWV